VQVIGIGGDSALVEIENLGRLEGAELDIVSADEDFLGFHGFGVIPMEHCPRQIQRQNCRSRGSFAGSLADSAAGRRRRLWMRDGRRSRYRRR
jgi:hypothetical protein